MYLPLPTGSFFEEERISQHWSIWDICCNWRYLNMHVTVAVMETASLFWFPFDFFSGRFPLFSRLPVWLLVCSQIWNRLYTLVLGHFQCWLACLVAVMFSDLK
jgi:hypothetical protein